VVLTKVLSKELFGRKNLRVENCIFITYQLKQTNMQTLYKVEEYTDRNSGNVCELFQVVVDGILVYERDYGSVGSGIQEYIEDYLEFII